jgi:hypothetical protein
MRFPTTILIAASALLLGATPAHALGDAAKCKAFKRRQVSTTKKLMLVAWLSAAVFVASVVGSPCIVQAGASAMNRGHERCR